jgi:tripartite-type tricarboxylate transporter receptor subunit TctC
MRFLIAALCAGLAFAHHASAQYPSKPIRLVSQFVPGSAGDNSLRIFVPAMSQSMGQPVVIDNRAGAGGLLAAQGVLSTPPDGHTILASSSAFYVIRPFLVKDMPFDPEKAFSPITLYEEAYSLLVTNPSLPVSSMKEVLDHARANPGKLTFGTSGIGTEGHLMGEQIMRLAGVKMTHVPYKAGSAALADVMAGQIQSSFSIHALALSFINAGKVKAIAIVRDARLPRLPNLPSIGETVQGFEAVPSWTGIFGPAGMTPALVQRVQSEFAKAAKDPATMTKLADGGFLDVQALPTDAFVARMKREVALISRLVKAAGIKPE